MRVISHLLQRAVARMKLILCETHIQHPGILRERLPDKWLPRPTPNPQSHAAADVKTWLPPTSSLSCCEDKPWPRTSLVVWWLRIRRPMQGNTGSIPSLGRSHMPQGTSPCAPRLLKPSHPRACAPPQAKPLHLEKAQAQQQRSSRTKKDSYMIFRKSI